MEQAATQRTPLIEINEAYAAPIIPNLGIRIRFKPMVNIAKNIIVMTVNL